MTTAGVRLHHDFSNYSHNLTSSAVAFKSPEITSTLDVPGARAQVKENCCGEDRFTEETHKKEEIVVSRDLDGVHLSSSRLSINFAKHPSSEENSRKTGELFDAAENAQTFARIWVDALFLRDLVALSEHGLFENEQKPNKYEWLHAKGKKTGTRGALTCARLEIKSERC